MCILEVFHVHMITYMYVHVHTGGISCTHDYICICYVMPRVLYQVYNHRARGPQARGQGDYKPDIARVGMT